MKTLFFSLLLTFCCHYFVSAQKVADSSKFYMKPNAVSFCGGGLCIGYELGAYCTSRKFVDYSNVKVITATSAGTIVALVHLLNFSEQEIKELWLQTDCKKMRGKKRPHISFTGSNYLFTGDGIKEIVETMLEQKGYPKHITMQQLSEKLGVKLYFMATLVNGKTIVPIAFGDSLHADIGVALAARISCSVSSYIRPYGCDSTGTQIDTVGNQKHSYYLRGGHN